MADVKAFTIAQKESKDTDTFGEPLDVELAIQWPEDGEEEAWVERRTLTFLAPNSTEMTIITMAMAQHNQMFQAVASCLDLVLGLIKDDNDRRWLHGALLNRNHPLAIDDVTDLVLWLVEEWTARPTERPSGSSPRPRPTGARSTAQRHRKASAR